MPRGSPNAVDITGEVYGRLTVIARAGSQAKASLWLCKCSCGGEKIVSKNNLHSNHGTRSCGCLFREVMKNQNFPHACLPPGQAAKNALLSGYIHSARKRGVAWELSEPAFFAMTQQPCFYCGAEPQTVYTKGKNGSYIYNGVDRADPALGYTASNTVPCCGLCNFAKGSMSQQIFLAWVRRVAAHIDTPASL